MADEAMRLCPHLQNGNNYSYKSLNELYVNYNAYFSNQHSIDSFCLKAIIYYVNRKWYRMQLLEWNMHNFVVFIGLSDFFKVIYFMQKLWRLEEYKEESLRSHP